VVLRRLTRRAQVVSAPVPEGTGADMTPLSIVIAAFVAALLLFGFAFWTPIYAIPLVLLVLLAAGALHLKRRTGDEGSLREFRKQVPGNDEIEFTERDRQTLYDPS
jgi:hypothetical protein